MADPDYIVDGTLTDTEAWVALAHETLTADVVIGALSAEQLCIILELIIKGVQALVDLDEHSQKQVEAL